MSLILFAVIVLSDFLDGVCARKWGPVTSLGDALDCWADFLVIISFITYLTVKGIVPILLPALTVVSFFSFVFLRARSKRNRPGVFGRYNGAVLFGGIFILLVLKVASAGLFVRALPAVVVICCLYLGISVGENLTAVLKPPAM